jgi:hypothetical protein
MATKKSNKEISSLDKLKNLFGTVKENVIEGATVVTDKIKEKSAEVYVAGSELVEDANDRIHMFTDKVSLQREQKTIESRQKEIHAKFGKIALTHYAKNDSLHKAFLTTKTVDDLVNEFKTNVKDLNSITKKLKKINA